MSDSPENAGFVAPEPADLAPHFPGYEIESLIATGGMGAVYLAVQRSLERNVAIKILPLELSKDAAFRSGFEAEAKAMGRLNHPNLIGVFDFGDVGGMLFIIMEFVPGKSLYHSADGMAIDQLEVARLVTGICSGLAHAHEHQILHRDIKPSNILLDMSAEPKIGDFGLARPADWTIEEGEEIFGTPHYTAPEVVDAPHSVDHRADIFSVGVVLHELLTGKLPAIDPRPASAIVRCDSRFDAIVKRATQPLAFARYSSAREMAAEIQTIATSLASNKVPRPGSPVAAHRLVRPAPASTARFRQRPKKSAGAPLLLLLLALVAGVAAYLFSGSKAPPVAPRPEENSPPVVILPKDGAEPKPTVKPPVKSGITTSDIPPVRDTRPEPGAGDTNQQTSPVVGTEPPDAVEIPKPVESKFDVDAFFERARRIMKERAAPQITAHQKQLVSNLSNFEGTLARQARKVRGDTIKSDLASAVESWREDGRIPAEMPGDLSTIPDIEAIHTEYSSKQTGIDDTLHGALVALNATYMIGLEKQIERSEKDGDTAAAKLIKSELDRTVHDTDYLPDLLMGKEADTPDESE